MGFVDSLLSLVFQTAGDVVGLLGGTLAVFTIGLLPIYVAIVVNLTRKIPIRRSGLSLVLYSGAVIISMLACAVLIMTAMVRGMWG